MCFYLLLETLCFFMHRRVHFILAPSGAYRVAKRYIELPTGNISTLLLLKVCGSFRVIQVVGSLFSVFTNSQSRFHSPWGRYFCSVERKSNQKRPLSPPSESLINLPLVFAFYLLGDKNQIVLHKHLSLIGDLLSFCFLPFIGS